MDINTALETAKKLVIHDEITRVNATGVFSEFEWEVQSDIIKWVLESPIPTYGMDMKDVTKLFWNERI